MKTDTQGQRLKFLLQNLDITQQELANSVGVSQSAISQIVKNKTVMSVETILKISNTYNVDCNWLVKGIGEPFMRPQNARIEILPVTVDSDNNPNIVLVPVKAQAGYAAGRIEPSFLQTLPAFSLPIPNLRQGTYRAFEVDGDSMEPSLYKGDLIICRYVEDWKWLRDFHLYVVIVEGDVLVKRVQNRLRTDGFLDLLSDNSYYPPMTLTNEDIVEVWAVFARITPHFPAPSENARELAQEITKMLRKGASEAPTNIPSYDASTVGN